MQELNLAGTFRPWRMLLTTLPPTRMARKGLSQLFYKDIFYEAIYFISSCSFLLCKFPTVQIEMFQFSPPDSLYRREKQSRPLKSVWCFRPHINCRSLSLRFHQYEEKWYARCYMEKWTAYSTANWEGKLVEHLLLLTWPLLHKLVPGKRV